MKIVKAIALLLLLSVLISAFAPTVLAADTEQDGKDTLQMHLNRSFDEGWDAFNGAKNGLGENSATIDSEELSDFTKNYFLRLEKKSSENGYIEVSLPSAKQSGEAYLEFDIKIDATTNIGSILYILTTPTAATRTYAELFSIKNNEFVLNNGGYSLGTPKNWLRVCAVFELDSSILYCSACKTFFDGAENQACENTANCTDATPLNVMPIRYYFGGPDSYDPKSATEFTKNTTPDYSSTYYVDTYQSMLAGQQASMYLFRLGFIGTKSDSVGQGYCIDNLKYYLNEAPKDDEGNPSDMLPRTDLSSYGYGTAVDENKIKTVDISDGSDTLNPMSSGIVMKTGSNYMLNNGERVPIYIDENGKPFGAPIKHNGTVYIPLEPVLNSTGFPIFKRSDGYTIEISTKSGSSILTIGRDTAVINGKRTALDAAPMMYTDESADKTFPVISILDVSKFFNGYYLTYDEMGLIIIAEDEISLSRDSDLSFMLDIMKKLIFDYYSGDEMYRVVEENTNGFDHPYLMANDEQFAFMHSVYTGEREDAEYKRWLDEFVHKMESVHEKYTTLPDPDKVANHTYLTRPERFSELAFEITNPHDGIKDGIVWSDSPGYVYVSGPDENGEYWPSESGKENNGKNYNNGLDQGRRNYQCYEYYGVMIRNLALAYRITEDIKFARLTYELLISFTDERNWPHWCDVGEFLITSETGSAVSLAYDWCYDVFDTFDHEYSENIGGRTVVYDLDYIAQQIYKRVIYTCYEKTNGGTTSFLTWKINWNAVCTTGTVISALAIMGERGDSIDFVEEDGSGNRVLWALSTPLSCLIKNGLDIYAPDGSYIESPAYWAFATNNLSMLMWAVNTAVGDDLGFFELWGIDKTYYYAIQIEFSIYTKSGANFGIWGYHDGGTQEGAGQSTDMYLFASEMLRDEGLAAIRLSQIQQGKAVSWTDIIGYRCSYSDIDPGNVSLSKDYRLEACEAVVARSDWEPGSLFTGIMGNANNCTEHGQVDSGNFVYANDGYYWFIDLGADRYTVYNYFGHSFSSPRYNYYRNTAEGHNLVLLTSQQSTMPHGQSWYGGGVITDFHSEDAGMYAVLDNSGAYADLTTYARRGLLLTNGRKTTVIQDEISFNNVQSAVWVAHTTASVSLDEKGRTAYLRATVDEKPVTIRVSIVSENEKYKFEIIGAGVTESDFLLDATNRPDYSTQNGGLAEYGRVSIKRLIIRADNTLNFNVSIVIERVDGVMNDTPVAYEYTPISKWSVYEKFESESPDQTDDSLITNSLLTDVKKYTSEATKMWDKGYALTTRTFDFYKALVRVTAAINTYRPEVIQEIPSIKDYYDDFLIMKAYYDAYRSGINDIISRTRKIADNLLTLK